jgi:hypothetical protein
MGPLTNIINLIKEIVSILFFIFFYRTTFVNNNIILIIIKYVYFLYKDESIYLILFY